jgi:hypothetical protein
MSDLEGLVGTLGHRVDPWQGGFRSSVARLTFTNSSLSCLSIFSMGMFLMAPTQAFRNTWVASFWELVVMHAHARIINFILCIQNKSYNMSKKFHKILQFHITFNKHNTSLYFNNFRLYPSNGRPSWPFCYTTIHKDLSSHLILQKKNSHSSWPLVGVVAAADLQHSALLLRNTSMLYSNLCPAQR